MDNGILLISSLMRFWQRKKLQFANGKSCFGFKQSVVPTDGRNGSDSGQIPSGQKSCLQNYTTRSTVNQLTFEGDVVLVAERTINVPGYSNPLLAE
jgi:hypothetical protein